MVVMCWWRSHTRGVGGREGRCIRDVVFFLHHRILLHGALLAGQLMMQWSGCFDVWTGCQGISRYDSFGRGVGTLQCIPLNACPHIAALCEVS